MANSDAAPEIPVPRIYRAGDYARETAHFAGALALSLAAGYWVGPIKFALAAGIASVTSVIGRATVRFLFPKLIVRREVNPGDINGLTEIVDDLMPRARLSHRPIFYHLEIDKEQMTNLRFGIFAIPAQLQRVMHATAFTLTRRTAIVSEPWLQSMQPQELRAEIAREFAGLGGRHAYLQAAAGWLQTVTMHTAMYGLGAVVVGMEGLVGMAPFLGTLVIGLIGTQFLPKRKDRYTGDGVVRPQARRRQMAIWMTQETLSISILAFPNPFAVLTAMTIEHGFFWSANLVNKSHFRRHEFQKDRGAVDLGADPLALIMALRKRDAVLHRDEPELAASLDWRTGSRIRRGFRLAESLFKPFPDTQRRTRRLARMAERQGRSAEEISAALQAPIDLSTLPPAPVIYAGTDEGANKGASRSERLRSDKKTGQDAAL